MAIYHPDVKMGKFDGVLILDKEAKATNDSWERKN